MALTVGELTAKITLDKGGYDKDVSDVKKGLEGVETKADDAEKAAGGLKTKLGDVAKIASGFAVAKGLESLGRAMLGTVGSASDVEESQNKVNVVFGESSGVIDEFASNSTRALGLSKGAALEATGTFGNLFTSMGLAQGDAADLSKSVLTLGADLGSFNNLGTDEVLEKLRAGLVGEVEPLRSLGINLNAAAVEAKAMEMGLVDANGEISESAKIQARYALIMEQSKNAQGDFARTSDGLANSQKIVGATFQDISARIGGVFLPVVTSLMVMFATALPVAVEIFAGIFGGLSAVMSPVINLISGNLIPILIGAAPLLAGVGAAILATVIPAFVAWTVATWASVAAHIAAAAAWLAAYAPIIAILAAVGLAAAALYLAWDSNFLGIQDITQRVIDFVRPYIETAIQGVQDFFETAWPIISGAVQTAWDLIQAAIETAIKILEPIVETYINGLQTLFETVWPLISKAVEVAWDAIKIAVDTVITIKETIERVIGEIKTTWDTIWDAIKGKAAEIWDGAAGIYQTIKGAIDSVKTTVDTVIGEVRDIWRDIWDEVFDKVDLVWNGVTGIIATVSTAIGEVKDFFSDLPDDILTAIGDVTTLLKDIGTDIIDGLWDGLKDKWDDVTGWFGDITDEIPKLKGPESVDKKLLFNSGRWLMQGLQSGIESEKGALVSILGDVTSGVKQSAENAFGQFQKLTGATGQWKDTFNKYVAHIVRYGDFRNDWITHLPEAWRDEARNIGKQLAETLHPAKSNAILDAGNAAMPTLPGGGTGETTTDLLDYEKLGDGIVAALRRGDPGRPIIFQVGEQALKTVVVKLLNEHAQTVYG